MSQKLQRIGIHYLSKQSQPHHLVFLQVARLSQRDRAAGWVNYGQKWKTGTGRQYYTDIISRAGLRYCGALST